MFMRTNRTTVRGQRAVRRTQMPWPYVLRHATSVAAAATIAAVCVFSLPTHQDTPDAHLCDGAMRDALSDARRREESP